jgi:hypothetical protein
MKEFFKNLWLILAGLNVGLFLFSIAFQQYDIAVINMLSVICFLTGYSIASDKEELSEKLEKLKDRK